MRADAARNLEAVVQTGAVVLARDPGASMAAIAAEAGVDRSTVYRRFPSRDALLAAVYQAKLAAVAQAFDEARLLDAPVPVALHRLMEGMIAVSRRWPVDREQMDADPATEAPVAALLARLEAFLDRAVAEGALREGLPEGWATAMVEALVDVAAHRQTDLAPGPAADVAVASLLGGLGPAPAPRPS